jgi:hypothetical protein
LGTDLIGRALAASRGSCWAWTAGLGGALTLMLLPWAAQGGVLAEYDYTVMRDGEPIGTHHVTVSPQGPDTKVEEKTDVEVSFGPITLFHMEHQRDEFWRDGELESMTAHTDKNGDIYDIKITREPDGMKRVINGRTDRFDPSVKLLTLWHEDLFKYSNFVSPMEDRTYQVSVDFVGTEKLDLVGQSVDAFVYRMSGDTNREIWFDSDGLIMKVRLLDHSPNIEYVLNSLDEASTKLAMERPERPTVAAHHGPVARLAARR